MSGVYYRPPVVPVPSPMIPSNRFSFRRHLLAALLACAVGVSACARGAAPAKRARPLIGVTLLTQTHTFYKELEDALRKEAAAKNMDLVVVACEMDPTKQAAQLEDFVAQHVD